MVTFLVDNVLCSTFVRRFSRQKAYMDKLRLYRASMTKNKAPTMLLIEPTTIDAPPVKGATDPEPVPEPDPAEPVPDGAAVDAPEAVGYGFADDGTGVVCVAVIDGEEVEVVLTREAVDEAMVDAGAAVLTQSHTELAAP